MIKNSLQEKLKPKSHTKLPKIISSQSVDNLQKNSSRKSQILNPIVLDNSKNRGGAKSQSDSHRNLINLKLTPIKKQVLNKKEIIEKLQALPNQQIKGKHKINLKKRGQLIHNISEMPDIKKQNPINNAHLTLHTQAARSEGSSREDHHPIFAQINTLLSSSVQTDVIPTKMYPQKLFGDCSAQWWCVVDSLFVSLQKLIRVKKPSDQKTKAQSPSKAREKPSGRSLSPENRKKIEQINEPPKVLTKIKSSLELTHVYACLESQIYHNQKCSLRPFQDQNHIALVLEAYFYEKAIIYLLGSIKKWAHPEQIFNIHSLAIEIIPCVRENRKLIAEILLEHVENMQQDNKIRKPKYIARQKKLIQISKFIALMKENHEKCLNNLGSMNRYKSFLWPQSGYREHEELFKLEINWKKLIFDIPKPPYIPCIIDEKKKKNMILVLQPLNTLYKYNKKEQTLHILPYAQNFLEQLCQYFHIIFFTHSDKEQSLLNFIGSLENKNVEIFEVLDKHYLSYSNAKQIKDIRKIGGSSNFSYAPQSLKNNNKKILVIDQKANQKYYAYMQEQRNNLVLLDGNYGQAKIGRVGGKLVKIQDESQDHLKFLARKIIKSLLQEHDWHSLHKQHSK